MTLSIPASQKQKDPTGYSSHTQMQEYSKHPYMLAAIEAEVSTPRNKTQECKYNHLPWEKGGSQGIKTVLGQNQIRQNSPTVKILLKTNFYVPEKSRR